VALTVAARVLATELFVIGNSESETWVVVAQASLLAAVRELCVLGLSHASVATPLPDDPRHEAI